MNVKFSLGFGVGRRLVAACSVAVLGTIGLSGCATDPQQQGAEEREEAEYVTGSNLPKRSKDGVKVIDKGAVEEMRRNANSVRPGAPG